MTDTNKPIPEVVYIPSSEAVSDIAELINIKLAAGQSVLWFVSGGSSIEVEIAVRNQLQLTDTTRLSVVLTDERYVELDDANSNMKQLIDGGFDTTDLTLFPILQEGLSLEQTADAYQQTIQQLFAATDVCLGMFGMGRDGHTAGILPGSPMALDPNSLVGCYEGPEFNRISLSFKGIRCLKEAVLYANGVDKWAQLEKLRQDISLETMPVQVLKHFVPLKVYTDYKE